MRLNTFRGSWGEPLRRSAPARDGSGSTISGIDRRRLPGNAVVEPEVGLGPAEAIPVRHRLGGISPPGRSAAGVTSHRPALIEIVGQRGAPENRH